MAKRQLIVTLTLQLPDDGDPFAVAAHYAHFQPAWAALLDALKTSGANYDVKFKELRLRGPGRPRKPRLVPPPEAA